MKKQRKSKRNKTTRNLMNVKAITERSLVPLHGEEIVFFLIQPTNVSVLSRESL